MFDNYIQPYINNFRRLITPHLRPGIGLAVTIHPSKDGGAVLVFTMGQGFGNEDRYEPPSQNLGVALSKTNQRAIGGSLQNIHFSGTNTILNDGQIILIKDGDTKEWSEKSAQKDVNSILARQ